MLGTILLIILILLLVGALPRWPYSGGWGYYPQWRGRSSVDHIDNPAARRQDLTGANFDRAGRNEDAANP